MPWLTRSAQRRIVPIEAYPVKGGRTRIYSGIRYGDLTYVRDREGLRGAVRPVARPG